ncbi:methylated-DNA--[protein]-cysteine S-methyltransferase [Lewinella sp. IMCC34183]|uniref:methylated-DNA--[protein]-cysteine S-methyltransferase n=1 Tax=Lewinella sp. IMCC34183 TaxID=2248762 RepID=UPI000E240C8F|nr:methylated-DNA--[protein]-cysteine S-methyltransferase [Lewinella sp. IMCC34183]
MRRIIPSPLGPIELRATDRGLSHATFLDEPPSHEQAWDPDTPAGGHLALAAEEFNSYFAGNRAPFTVPLDPGGTDFQRAVWTKLRAVPRGYTTTYGELARAVGNPNGSQAVGAANGQNPLAVIVPCHRVVGTDGKLTGYAGGIERKTWLLRHESAALF